MSFFVFLVVFALVAVVPVPSMTTGKLASIQYGDEAIANIIIKAANSLCIVFIQEPGSGLPVTLAPLGTQTQLNCRVSEEYQIATWNIILPGDDVALTTEVPALQMALEMQHGIVAQSFDSMRRSLLTVNGTADNNGTLVACIAMLMGEPTDRKSSETTVLILYGKLVICIIEAGYYWMLLQDLLQLLLILWLFLMVLAH